MVQSAVVAPLMLVRDLGVHLDSDMSMHTHVTPGLKVGPGRQGRRPGTLLFAGSITGLLFTLL